MAPGRFEPYKSDDHLASCALIDYESPVPFITPATIDAIDRLAVQLGA